LFSFSFFIVSFIFVSPAFSLSSSSITVHFENNSLTINSRPPVPAASNTCPAKILSSSSQPNEIFNARCEGEEIFNARKDSGSLQTKASISKIL
jgi:hypothetical protein